MVNKFILGYVLIISVAIAGSIYLEYLSPPPNPRRRVVISDTVGATITFSGGDSYSFSLIGMDSGAYVWVSSPLFNQGEGSAFFVREGKTYGFYKIEIRVAEVSPAIVLLVKPLST